MMTMKRLWLVAVLTLCVGATASAYDLTVAPNGHGVVGFSVGGTAVTTAEAGQVVTITVTPDEGYTTKSVTARAYTTWEAAARRAPGLIDDITATKQQDGTWQFTMPEANVQVKVSYVQIVDYDDGEVTKDEDGYTVNLTENASNSNPDPLPDDVDLSNLTYERDLTAPSNEQGGDGSGDIVIDEQPANLFTVCLPFAPKTIATAKYYTLTGVSGETLHFDEVAEVQSHTPYLVAVFGDVNITENCTDLEINSMDINSTTVDGYTFTGTFTGKKNADAQGLYVLQRNSQWGKVTSGSVFIPPFRAYVEAPAISAPLLEGTVGEATAIRSIRTTDMNGTERYFDLQGRRMEKTATKGIYIHNGRKEVLK